MIKAQYIDYGHSREDYISYFYLIQLNYGMKGRQYSNFNIHLIKKIFLKHNA